MSLRWIDSKCAWIDFIAVIMLDNRKLLAELSDAMYSYSQISIRAPSKSNMQH